MTRFRPSRVLVFIALVVGALVLLPSRAAEDSAVLFRDVRIFDGVDSELTAGDVLVVGNKISQVVPGGGLEAPAGAVVIEGNKRILSPGFIDIHAHLTISLPVNRLSDHPWVVGAMTGVAARSYLDQGFTTVRDAGGTHPDIARAVDEGLFPGPRIYPSRAMLTQTSGHGDFRDKNAPHPTLCNCGSSHYLQPAPEEIRSAVQAAGDWGTYVMAHAYTSEAVQRLVNNGVKIIEHGLLIDEETAKLCADRGVVMSTQVAVFRMGADLPGMTDNNRAKMQQVLAGQDNLMGFVKKYGLKTGFGTDLVFGMYDRLGMEFTARRDYFTPAEILRQATSESAEIIRMVGKLDRYEHFGEIREGWLADLLLIEGDPFEDISILEQPGESLAVIMKDGKFHKQ